MALAALLLTLLQCERYYHSDGDYTYLPTFTSSEAGTVSETSWVVTGYAANWEVARRFDVDLSLGDVILPSDTTDTASSRDSIDSAESGLESESGDALVRMTLAVDDGDEASLDYGTASPSDYIMLPLSLCSEDPCRVVVRARIEALSPTAFAFEPRLYASIMLNPGCMNNPSEEDVAGLSVTIEPLIEE